MKITIIGGSKGTGAQLASLAHAADFDVTALSRSGTAPDGVRAIAGDATNPAVVADAVSGADAVVVTVGGTKGAAQPRTAITESVIAAMQETGVRRLVIQSSLGAGESITQLPALMRPIIKLLLGKALADHTEQEAVVRASGLDWTIVRPTSLNDKQPTGSWTALRVGEEGKISGSISRGDLAACILESVTDHSTIGGALGVSG
ncbi:NAD(P)-dependent oxidoreductase [Demequina oxidasica]|uniref:NAD(P)-dependent oxidoreductase n=1 Tax=Demequina oxidasica TaxID=676199 RepID=UPI0007828518|nr:NAD(P)-binding oxidoreductase [Demequina oxidasica]